MALKRARKLRRDQPKGELRLWRELRKAREVGMTFRRHAPVENYVVDFLCRKAMVIVEIDGWVHESRGFRDRKRQRELEHLGYAVWRISSSDANFRSEEIAQSIVERCFLRFQELRAREETPSP